MIEYRDEIEEILHAIKEAERYGYSQFELETELDRILSKVADNAYNCGTVFSSTFRPSCFSELLFLLAGDAMFDCDKKCYSSYCGGKDVSAICCQRETGYRKY